jgi:hypothetical protein
MKMDELLSQDRDKKTESVEQDHITGKKVFIGQETGRTGDRDREQDSQNRAT